MVRDVNNTVGNLRAPTYESKQRKLRARRIKIRKQNNLEGQLSSSMEYDMGKSAAFLWLDSFEKIELIPLNYMLLLLEEFIAP